MEQNIEMFLLGVKTSSGSMAHLRETSLAMIPSSMEFSSCLHKCNMNRVEDSSLKCRGIRILIVHVERTLKASFGHISVSFPSFPIDVWQAPAGQRFVHRNFFHHLHIL